MTSCPGSYRSTLTGEYICLGDGRVCEGEENCTVPDGPELLEDMRRDDGD